MQQKDRGKWHDKWMVLERAQEGQNQRKGLLMRTKQEIRYFLQSYKSLLHSSLFYCMQKTALEKKNVLHKIVMAKKPNM